MKYQKPEICKVTEREYIEMTMGEFSVPCHFNGHGWAAV